LHQLLGEDLARFYLGGGPSGAEGGQTSGLKLVDDAGGQGGLGADDGKINPLFLSYLSQ